MRDRLNSLVRKLLKNTLVLYVLGGGGAACIHILIVACLVELYGYGKEGANSIGFVVGVVVNYLFQYFVTFRNSAGDHWQQFPLFVGFAVIGLGINRFVYSHGINDLHLQYLVAAAFAIGVVFMFNFTANRLITFRDAHKGEQPLDLFAEEDEHAEART